MGRKKKLVSPETSPSPVKSAKVKSATVKSATVAKVKTKRIQKELLEINLVSQEMMQVANVWRPTSKNGKNI